MNLNPSQQEICTFFHIREPNELLKYKVGVPNAVTAAWWRTDFSKGLSAARRPLRLRPRRRDREEDNSRRNSSLGSLQSMLVTALGRLGGA